jgi:hypothetical protein
MAVSPQVAEQLFIFYEELSSMELVIRKTLLVAGFLEWSTGLIMVCEAVLNRRPVKKTLKILCSTYRNNKYTCRTCNNLSWLEFNV